MSTETNEICSECSFSNEHRIGLWKNKPIIVEMCDRWHIIKKPHDTCEFFAQKEDDNGQ